MSLQPIDIRRICQGAAITAPRKPSLKQRLKRTFRRLFKWLKNAV